MKLRKGDKVLRPVHPNVGLEVEYRRKLKRLVDEMSRSYAHWIRAQYRRDPPAMAMDEPPSRKLERELSILGRQWLKRFDEAAPKLAQWFALATHNRSRDALKRILADAGISIPFQMTPAMRDVFHATVVENVSLIKSIQSQYHAEVQGMVMRSAAAGRDLEILTKDLQSRFGVTNRRAALIARDQNNKCTASFVRVRQEQLGLKAKWLHSAGGKEPRPTHVANSGKLYDPAKGWLDPAVGRRIWPGTEINCRCVSVSVVPGFS